MSFAVRYYTRSGNTQKLAEAAAEVLEVEAKAVDTALEEKADVLFLGSSVYAGGFAPEIAAFLKENADRIGKLALIGSSASGKSVYAKLKAQAAELGIEVCDRFYHCPGHFLFLHKNRPNEEDLQKVKDFVREIIQ